MQKHQQQQKAAHDNSEALAVFKPGELVLVQNHRGASKWLNGRILRRKGPVSYLVTVGSKVLYCHVDHLLRRRATSKDNPSATDFTCIPDEETSVDPHNVSGSTEPGGRNQTVDESPQP